MTRNYRHEGRHEVEVWGKFRPPSGVLRDVLVKDLSETGCRFYDRFSSLSVDQEIRLSIEKLGPFSAVVRWCREDYIGVEFERRLYGPVFDHIRLRLSRGPT